MISKRGRRTNLPKDAVQQTRGRGSGIGDRGRSATPWDHACRRTNLPKDEVQQTRGQGSGIGDRGRSATPWDHEDFRGPGV
jgi:hypothetical protein